MVIPGASSLHGVRRESDVERDGGCIGCALFFVYIIGWSLFAGAVAGAVLGSCAIAASALV